MSTKHKSYMSHLLLYFNDVGFVIMFDPESPRTLFDIFRARGPQQMLLAYDNVCNAAEFFYNREGPFFKNYVFVVDQLHGPNHVNCTAGM
jgi:hypothetical protein